jgi:hypothetical protein
MPAVSSSCVIHRQPSDDCFVALVEGDPQRSGAPDGNGNMKPKNAYRTGRPAHLKRQVFPKVFNVLIVVGHSRVFVEPGVIEQLLRTAAKDFAASTELYKRRG